MKFTKALLITKLKATAIHLSMSIAVFAYLAYLIIFVWYPEPYFSVDGGWQGLRLVAAVDLVLGPFITFLIFNPNKSMREIVFDLFIIAVIQFGALAYGVYTTYAQRPVAVVIIDEFVLSAIEENYGGTLESTDQLAAFSDEKPPIIFSDLPLTQEAVAEANRIKIEEKVLEHAQMHLYVPKQQFGSKLAEKQTMYLSRLESYGATASFEAWLKTSGKTADDVMIAPFGGRYGRVWLVFDDSGKYIDYFD